MSTPTRDAVSPRKPTPHGETTHGRSTARAWSFGIAGVVGAVLLWALAARYLAGNIGNIDRLAGPLDVARDIGSYATDEMAEDLWSSFQVFLGGWLIGGAGAMLVGVLLGRVRVAGQMFLPLVEAIRPVSSIVWLPLSIVWFGFGFTSKAFVVGLAVFLVVIVYVIDGCARIPADVQRSAAMLGMTRGQRLWHVILPATFGEAVIGLRVALVAGWGTVIIAELIAANSGLGAHLVSAQRGFNISAVIATMIVFGATGFIIDSLFSLLQGRLTPWHKAAR